MLRIAVCDDEVIHHKLFQDHLDQFQKRFDEQIELKRYYNAMDLLESKFNYDILFLDIGLEEEDGVSVGIKLRDQGCKAIFIILTSHVDRHRDAFRAGVHRYLEKPIAQPEFDEALTSAIKSLQTMRYVIHVNFEGSRRFLPIQDIIYISNYNRRRFIHLTSEAKAIETNTPWDHIVPQLPQPLFCYVQKSYLVNFHHVTASNTKEVFVSNGEKINISRNYKKSFEKAYAEYVEAMTWEAHYLTK